MDRALGVDSPRKGVRLHRRGQPEASIRFTTVPAKMTEKRGRASFANDAARATALMGRVDRSRHR